MSDNNQRISAGEVRRLFNVIRNEEIKNVKTQNYDDKQMVARLTKYLLKEKGGKENSGNEI